MTPAPLPSLVDQLRADDARHADLTARAHALAADLDAAGLKCDAETFRACYVRVAYWMPTAILARGVADAADRLATHRALCSRYRGAPLAT